MHRQLSCHGLGGLARDMEPEHSAKPRLELERELAELLRALRIQAEAKDQCLNARVHLRGAPDEAALQTLSDPKSDLLSVRQRHGHDRQGWHRMCR